MAINGGWHSLHWALIIFDTCSRYNWKLCVELWRLFLRNPNTNPSNATKVCDEREDGMSQKMRRTCEIARVACSNDILVIWEYSRTARQPAKAKLLLWSNRLSSLANKVFISLGTCLLASSLKMILQRLVVSLFMCHSWYAMQWRVSLMYMYIRVFRQSSRVS